MAIAADQAERIRQLRDRYGDEATLRAIMKTHTMIDVPYWEQQIEKRGSESAMVDFLGEMQIEPLPRTSVGVALPERLERRRPAIPEPATTGWEAIGEVTGPAYPVVRERIADPTVILDAYRKYITVPLTKLGVKQRTAIQRGVAAMRRDMAYLPEVEEAKEIIEARNWKKIRELAIEGRFPTADELGADYLSEQVIKLQSEYQGARLRGALGVLGYAVNDPSASWFRRGEIPNLVPTEFVAKHPKLALAPLAITAPLEEVAHIATHPERWPGIAVVVLAHKFVIAPASKAGLTWLATKYPKAATYDLLMPFKRFFKGKKITSESVGAFMTGRADIVPEQYPELTPEVRTILSRMTADRKNVDMIAAALRKGKPIRIYVPGGKAAPIVTPTGAPAAAPTEVPVTPPVTTREIVPYTPPVEVPPVPPAAVPAVKEVPPVPEVQQPLTPAVPEVVSPMEVPPAVPPVEEVVAPPPEVVPPPTPDTAALEALGYTDSQIRRLRPEEAMRVLEGQIPAERVSVLQTGYVAEAQPAPGEYGKEITKSEPQFIDESPPIGLGIRQVIPETVTVEKPPKDLIGLSGWFKSWVAPTRIIAEKNPVANRLAHMGRDTVTGMTNQISHYAGRIDEAFKGLKKTEQETLVDYLESTLPVEQIPEELRTRYGEIDAIRKEFYAMIRDEMGIDVSKWGISPEEYWPHIFVGSYQIRVEGTDPSGKPAWKTIEGGFARNLREAVEKASAYLQESPDANIRISPRGFSSEYTATLLSRKGFWRFIGEVKKATEIDKDEILSMMRGIAAIKPRGKFVGNFMQRSTNLGGYLKGPIAMKIYASRVLRKKWLDPFRKEATNLATSLPPALKQFFTEYIDDVTGKFDPFDNKFRISKIASKITMAQSKLKLGYRPITAIVNRFQPMQQAYAEVGNYLFRGNIFKRTEAGRRVIEESGIHGQMPKYAAGEPGYMVRPTERLWHPLGMFTKAEMANREDVICGGYLFARKVFTMPREKASKLGYEYILQYLDQYQDPAQAALEYAKDLNADANFIYSAADLPKMFRTKAGRVIFQFKTYPINFLATTWKWTMQRPNNPHYWARLTRLVAMNVLLGGVRTVPYLGRKLWLALVLSPLVLSGLPEEYRDKAKRVLGRGVFTLLGVDLSQRLGPNEFLPRTLRDLLGPLGGDLYNFYLFSRGDRDWQQLLRTVPLARDLYRTFAETEYIADPNKRMRKVMEVTGWDKILQVAGVPLQKVEVVRDLQFIFNQMDREYKRKKSRYVDKAIKELSRNQEKLESITDPRKRLTMIKRLTNPIGEEALSEGITITLGDVDRELVKKGQPQLLREFLTQPLPLRDEVLDMMIKADKIHKILPTKEKEER